ncbi:MAG: hypothetical protein R3F05_19885 [Planctomycetota bacterium]
MSARPTTPDELPGIGLRLQALGLDPSELGFAPDEAFPQVYGVLTEWDLGGAVATVMSLRDGTASLYTTSAFGILGGGEHESVRLAAVRHVHVAGDYLPQAVATTDRQHAAGDEVRYWLLTYDGVHLVRGSMAALRSGGDPTRALFVAAQYVLTELRRLVEGAPIS